MIDGFLDGLGSASPAERISVAFGLAYALLAALRSRWCWVAGGISSAIAVLLFARAHLPMQATLNAYYVAMSFYGFWRWSAAHGGPALVIGWWPMRSHLIAWLAILVASLLSAKWLAEETGAAWPFLDSATTWASLLATWLVARMRIENWLYWMAIDSVLVFLTAKQGLTFFTVLYGAYLFTSLFGFFSWTRKRAAPAPAA